MSVFHTALDGHPIMIRILFCRRYQIYVDGSHPQKCRNDHQYVLLKYDRPISSLFCWWCLHIFTIFGCFSYRIWMNNMYNPIQLAAGYAVKEELQDELFGCSQPTWQGASQIGNWQKLCGLLQKPLSFLEYGLGICGYIWYHYSWNIPSYLPVQENMYVYYMYIIYIQIHICICIVYIYILQLGHFRFLRPAHSSFVHSRDLGK